MFIRKLFTGLTLAVTYVGSAFAAASVIAPPPTGLYLSPIVYDGTLYGPTDPSAGWNAGQFGSWANANLPAFSGGVSGNAAQRVEYRDTYWVMAQNGSGLPCYPAAKSEFDGFFGVNLKSAYYNSVYPGYPQVGTSSPPLSQITKLNHTLGVKWKYYQTYDTTCSVTRGQLITSLTLKNIVDNTTLFYQVVLGKFDGTPAGSGYFFSDGPATWGFADAATYFGQEPFVFNTHKVFSFNFAARLKQILRLCKTTNSDGTCAVYHFPDRDPAHWIVNNHYHGQVLWGHINATTEFDNFSLTYE